jgi:hypothetical protein
MPIEQTLRRVDADLEQGRVLPGINRLRGLVREVPDRLDLRLRLAAVYRSQGELAQAGRWSFLAEDVDAVELAAFERQFRTAAGRLAAIAWTGGTDDLGPQATERLTALRAAVAAETGRVLTKDGSLAEKPRPVEAALTALGCSAAVLALIGLGALVVHGARMVIGWF